jgi:hypothetical protein
MRFCCHDWVKRLKRGINRYQKIEGNEDYFRGFSHNPYPQTPGVGY